VHGRVFRFRRTAEQLALTPGFDRLIALDQNRIRELPHQIEVALRVLRPPMRGRAVQPDPCHPWRNGSVKLGEMVSYNMAKR
jgi:hypothetical protein